MCAQKKKPLKRQGLTPFPPHSKHERTFRFGISEGTHIHTHTRSCRSFVEKQQFLAPIPLSSRFYLTDDPPFAATWSGSLSLSSPLPCNPTFHLHSRHYQLDQQPKQRNGCSRQPWRTRPVPRSSRSVPSAYVAALVGFTQCTLFNSGNLYICCDSYILGYFFLNGLSVVNQSGKGRQRSPQDGSTSFVDNNNNKAYAVQEQARDLNAWTERTLPFPSSTARQIRDIRRSLPELPVLPSPPLPDNTTSSPTPPLPQPSTSTYFGSHPLLNANVFSSRWSSSSSSSSPDHVSKLKLMQI